ncbi:hypothetical protein ACFOYW_01385 [Gryllotalpicola reticulitermitis]|uniref:DUF2746 domain-containing protein n=1 Tax=Gryllotalpicola reticulitermitis TaxID=1184153 RepID=A0ABV8Q0Y9_9MICO
MNEAQVWAAIGLMASMLLSVMTVISRSFTRTMRAEFKAFRFEMASEFTAVRSEMASEFTAVRSEMASEFKAVRADIGAIDRDVQVLYRRALGGETE